MDWKLAILWLHFLALIAAVVLLVVPSWRRWLLSQPWSIILFIVAAHGAFYVALYWPEFLGGMSVGLPLIFALLGALAIWLLVSFINEWRADRASAIETLALVAIVTCSALAIEFWLGPEYWWLVIGPLVAYFAIRLFVARSNQNADTE